MTDSEKLIEEAVKAVLDAWQVRTMRPVDERLSLAETAVRVALAVVEKAHTPTDDEREAILLAQEVRSWADSREGWSRYEVDLGMRVVKTLNALVAGFRRTEVPEPSAEEWAARVNAAREKAIAKGYTPEHDAKHGVRHLLRWAIDYARRGRPEDSSGLVAAAIDLADIAYAELERLRHVADTMRAVAEALRTRYASDSQAAYFMRQIDAALEAVPEPQGEPSIRVIVMCARCGLFPVVAGDEINSDIVVCDRCAFAEGRESVQGEPSDAQKLLAEADALVEAWDQKGSWSADSPVGMVMQLARALRAAGVVGQEGEQPWE